MKNSNKKRGFTIVELIIVIAVIAILAAVLIPTFSSLINKSLVAADESLVRNLNEALAMDVTNPHNTMTDALKATKENGFDVSKINARASTDGQKHEILWDSRNDCFVYEKGGEINYIPKSNTKGDATDVELWHIANDGKLSKNYSNYLAAGTYAAPLDITTGLDVGEHTEITEINYSNTNKQKAVIRMNGGKLSVNAPSDDVYFYGYAQEANITEIAGSSFHVVDGIISYAEIAKGHFVVENDSIVNVLYTTAQTAKIDKQGNSIIGKALTTADAAKELKHGGNVSLTLDANGANKATNKENSVFRGEGTEESPYLISNANELKLYQEKVNQGLYCASTVYFKLTNDVDISIYEWTPIGVETSAVDKQYNGHFDGNNKTISGLTMSTGTARIGLFGIVYAPTIENVKLSGVSLNGEKRIGALVGQIKGNATITNCAVDSKSKIVGSDANVGGLIGEAINGTEIKLSNLINEAEVIAEGKGDGRAAGIIAQVTNGAGVTITNCINNGKISAMYAGGIVSALQSGKITIENCANNADISDFTGSSKANICAWMCDDVSISITAESNHDFTKDLCKVKINLGSITLNEQIYILPNYIEYNWQEATAAELSKDKLDFMLEFFQWVNQHNYIANRDFENASYSYFLKNFTSVAAVWNRTTASQNISYEDAEKTYCEEKGIPYSEELFQKTWDNDTLYKLV